MTAEILRLAFAQHTTPQSFDSQTDKSFCSRAVQNYRARRSCRFLLNDHFTERGQSHVTLRYAKEKVPAPVRLELTTFRSHELVEAMCVNGLTVGRCNQLSQGAYEYICDKVHIKRHSRC